MENKELIINILNLTQALKNKDYTTIDSIVANLNALEYTTESLTYLKDFLKNSFNYKDDLIYVVKGLDVITNKDFFYAFVDIMAFNNLSKEKVTEYLNATIVFDDSYEKNLYYSALTKQIINVGDPVLIKAAIDKIQSIQ